MTRKADCFRVTVVAPSAGDGPNWYMIIRPPAGQGKRQRKSTNTEDRLAAERMARELEKRMNKHLPPKHGSDPLVIGVYDNHVAFRETDRLTARNTYLSYASARSALAKAFDGVRGTDLCIQTIEAAQRTLLDVQGIAPITANLYMEKLAHAWKWAHRRGFPGVGPWPGHTALPTRRTAKRQYTEAEMDAVMREAQRYAGGRFVALFCLLGENGARIGEAVGLRGRDVDRAQGTITLTTTKTRGRRTRTVAVSPEVLAMIPERRPDDWVFRSVRDPQKPLSGRTVTSALVKILDRAGLGDAPLDLHSFRRYVVRKLHSAGVPLKDAMDFVGHDSVATHLAYMHDLQSQEVQRSIIDRARALHDPLRVVGTSSPGRDPAQPVPETGVKVALVHTSPRSAATPPDDPDDGPGGLTQAGHLDGSPDTSGADRSPSEVRGLSWSPDADALELVLTRDEAERDLLVRMAAEGTLERVILAAARRLWPDLVPAAAPAKKGGRRAAR